MTPFERANWVLLDTVSLSDLPDHGNFACGYAFRNGKTGEILYIGGTGSFRRRMFGNYLGGVGGETTQRLHGYLFQEGFIAVVEVAWFPGEKESAMEDALKDEYKAAHDGNLPPWNRR